MFVTIDTAFGLRSNQSRRVPDATDQRGRAGTCRARRSEARCGEATAAPSELGELPGFALLQYCSVGSGLLKVGLSSGSDRIADDSADSGFVPKAEGAHYAQWGQKPFYLRPEGSSRSKRVL